MRIKQFIFILIISFILLTICSMTSFLYPIHNRVDQNCFMTVGRGIVNGQVPYRDLFEHKGPYVYFMHAAAVLISPASFIGVFFIQFAFLIVFMVYIKKIASLFVSEKVSYYITLFTTALILTTNCYLRGDNTEEYGFTLITVSIYYLLVHYLKGNNDFVRGRIFFLNGIFIGFIFWSKFNLLGYWGGWLVFSLIPILIKRDYRYFIRSVCLFAAGFIVITIPLIIYFGLNNALYDLFYTYFYCNIFLYTKKNIFIKLFSLILGFIKNLLQNPVFTIVKVLGIYYFIIKDVYIKNKTCRHALLVSYLLLYLGVYWGGVWYDYYILITACYTVFGIIAVYNILANKVKFKPGTLVYWFKHEKKLMLTVTCMTIIVSVLLSNCLPYMFKSKNDYAQFKFAEIINKKPNATLLNYGFVDGGFYFAARIQPQNKYFHKVNISKEALPQMYEEQLSMIKNREVDFVVARLSKKQNVTQVKCPELYENYEVVTYADEIHDNYRYVLFKKAG